VHDAQETVTDATPGAVLINGAWGLGGIVVEVKNEDILSPLGKPTTFFRQGGGSGNDRYGMHGVGIHAFYGMESIGPLSGNLFIRGDGNLVVDWVVIDGVTGEIFESHTQTLYGPLNKPTAQDTGAVPVTGGSVDYLSSKTYYSVDGTGWPGAGALAGQQTDPSAPFYKGYTQVSHDTYCPIVKGTASILEGFRTTASFGLVTPVGVDFSLVAIHAICDDGTSTLWAFNPNGGHFSSPGNIYCLNLSAQGSVTGDSVWERDVRVYSPNNPPPAGVQEIRKGARITTTSQTLTADTGYLDVFAFKSQPDDSHVQSMSWSPLQYLINGTWQTVNFAARASVSTMRHINQFIPDDLSCFINGSTFLDILVDDSGYEWYAASKKLTGNYFIAVENIEDGGLVIGMSHDATEFFPAGCSVYGVDSLPEGFMADGKSWVFDGVNIIPRVYTPDETVARNTYTRDQLISNAQRVAFALQCAVDTGDMTRESDLNEIKRYVTSLMSADLDLKNNTPVWPEVPKCGVA
ncbi:tail fiber assembly protein, partial [Buttiauxella brennerae]|uniref:tail fiber assembly protein n=1 Tax=Buttiauxella brennerae TaxID=82988 RepID=UPI00286F2366